MLVGARNINDSKKTIEELGSKNCFPVRVDLNSQESINELSETLKKEYPEGIDVLINNAGISSKSSNIARVIIGTNYNGTVNLTQKILSQIKKDGRIVNGKKNSKKK